MKIERVDEKTVKCFLSNADLAEYELDYKDFIEHTDRAKEIVHEIMEQATEQVGYKPPQFAFDLQIMVVPEHGLVLTFSEREPGEEEGHNPLMEALKEMKRMMQQNAGEKKQTKEEKTAKEEKAPEAKDVLAKKPEQATFVFSSLRNVITYASCLPKNLRVESALFEMDGYYYLYLQKGGASYERYSRACIQALEFAALDSAEEIRLVQLREHGDCLIAEKALKKLHD